MFSKIVGWIIGLTLLGAAIFNLATTPAAVRHAREFNELARPVKAEVLSNEEYRTGTGTSSSYWHRAILRITGEDGVSREYPIDSSSSVVVGSTVEVWLRGDQVQWDNEWSAQWDGPFKQLAIGFLLLLFASLILFQMVKPLLPKPIMLEVEVYGDSRSDLKEVVAARAKWGEDGRLYIRWRDAVYPLRCKRTGGREDRPEGWILMQDGLRLDDEFFIFYDD